MRDASGWIRALAPSGPSWSPVELARRRAADAATIGAAVDAIGPNAVAWAVETADRITRRFEEDGELLGLPTASTGFSRQGAEEGLLVALVALAREWTPETIQGSPAMAGIAQRAVRQGVPIDALVHKAWASHAASQEEMLAMIERLVPPDQQISAVRAMSTAMFAYGNATVRALTEAYRRERRQWDGRTRQARRRVITDLARGAAVPVDAEAILGLSLSSTHCFALAFSTGGRHIPRLEDALDAFARRAADALGADRVLVLPHDAAVQLWWTLPAMPEEDVARILRRVGPPAGVSIGVGPLGAGVTGFRDAYHGAHDAARVGRTADVDDVWDYDAVAHLALLLADRAAARRFARHELGGLLAEDDRIADIRLTLRRYLETGNSRVAVAAELHIAPSTVAYRVAQAQEMLGPAMKDRPVQLLMALQLVQLMPDLVH